MGYTSRLLTENRLISPYGDPLTVAIFQVYPATGDMTNNDNLNDNNVGAVVEDCDVGKYVEVDLGKAYRITQHRVYGHATNNATSTWKIQTKLIASSSFIDWGTFTNRLATWSSWKTETEIIARYIRFVPLTKVGNNYLGEAEARF